MHIKKYAVENIGCIKAVSFQPARYLQIVSGANGQGKSCTLQGLAMLLSGKRADLPVPVREGQRRGTIEAEIVDDESPEGWKVSGGWTDSGGRMLKVTRLDTGAPISRPQETLSAFLGERTFDPMSFDALSDKEQRDALLQVCPLDVDLDALGAEHKELYDQRTVENRRLRDLQGELRSNHPPGEAFAGLPAEPADLGQLTQQFESMMAVLDTNRQSRQKLESLKNRYATLRQRREELRRQLANLEQEMGEQRQAGAVAQVAQERMHSARHAVESGRCPAIGGGLCGALQHGPAAQCDRLRGSGGQAART